MNWLKNAGVDLAGVEVKEGKKSFFWSGRYHLDMNSRDTLETQLNVLEEFDPILPESYKDSEFLILGNIEPSLQRKVIEQMNKRPKLIVLDTMNFWMDIALDSLMQTLKLVDVLVVNDSEARQLSGESSLVKASKKIMKMGPKYLIIKKGENGALLFYEKKEMDEGEKFLDRVKAQIEKYKHKLETEETRLLELISESKKRKLNATEMEELSELDSKIEKALDKESRIPNILRDDKEASDLAELLKKVDELAKKLEDKK